MSGETGAEGGAETGVGGLLLNQPIVIDNGSSTLKAGFAGGSKPKVGYLCIINLSNSCCARYDVLGI
jgi:Actin